jgi:hypothetical protein
MYSSGIFGKLYRSSLSKIYEFRKKPIGKAITLPLRWSWDGLYKAILFFKANTFKLSDTILVTGMPRSGTTWLGELLSVSRDYCMIFEPIVLWENKGVIKGPD